MSTQVPKIVVITGASSGIGLSTAKVFSELGCQVINLSRRPCPLKNVVNLVTDLLTPHFGRSLVDLLNGQHNTMALIHNAASCLKDSVLNLSDESLEQVLRINVVAPQELNRLMIPLMSPGSSILYVGSTLSTKAIAGAASYITSKHALVGLMRATCQDLVGTGIHTGMVCPGFTDTDMLRTHVGGKPEVMRALSQRQSFGRLVAPEEIAQVLLMMAQNPVINGGIIDANLGQIES